MSTHRIDFQVNGEPHRVEVPARRMLSDLLRDDLNLTGTKRGCETGTCGACSVRSMNLLPPRARKARRRCTICASPSSACAMPSSSSTR